MDSLKLFDSARWKHHTLRQARSDSLTSFRKKHTVWTAKTRRILLDWLREVCVDGGLQNNVYFCAVLYIDLYLDCRSSLPLAPSKGSTEQDITVQRLGTACLFIAALLHARSNYQYDVCCYDLTTTTKQSQRTAAEVISILGGHIYLYSTQYDFLRCFGISEDGGKQKSDLDCANNLALFYLESAVLAESISTRFSHPVIATACYALALRDACSFANLALETGLAVDEIMSCVAAIFADATLNLAPRVGLNERYAEWRLHVEGKEVLHLITDGRKKSSDNMRPSTAKPEHQNQIGNLSKTKKRKICDISPVDDDNADLHNSIHQDTRISNSAIFTTTVLFENKYQVVQRIGKGVYGSVYKCTVVCGGKDEENQQIFAVKRFVNNFTDADVLRELCILSALNHSNVISAKEIFIDVRPEKLFECRVVMPLITGPTLHEHLQMSGAMQENKTRLFTHQLCSAVAYLHDNNILHRDIKPQNIVLNKEITALTLVDFSVSRVHNDFDAALDTERLFAKGTEARRAPLKTDTDKQTTGTQESRLDLTQHSMTTLWYCPPELLSESSFSHSKALDLWSMGCVVVEMSTGASVFPGDSKIDQLSRIVKFLGPLKEDEKPLVETSFVVLFNHFYCNSSLEKSLSAKGVVNADAIDLISNWLRYIPQKRLPAKKALQHPYMTRK